MRNFKYLYKYGSKEQIERFHQSRRVAAEAARQMQEPEPFHIAPDFCGFILAVSYQCDEIVKYQAELYKAKRSDSFIGVINNKPVPGARGWYGWANHLAQAMPTRTISVY